MTVDYYEDSFMFSYQIICITNKKMYKKLRILLKINFLGMNKSVKILLI